MIIEIYITLFAISFLFLFYGWYSQSDLFRIIGLVIIVLQGLIIMPESPGAVEYQTGENQTIDGNNTLIEYTYTSYESHTVGFYITIAGLLGLSLIMVERRKSYNATR